MKTDLVPYLTKTSSLKDIDYYGKLNWETKSVLKIDKLLIFHDIQYENLMDDALYRLRGYNDNLKVIDKIIDNILLATAN